MMVARFECDHNGVNLIKLPSIAGLLNRQRLSMQLPCSMMGRRCDNGT
jgi:hypothetical protein